MNKEQAKKRISEILADALSGRNEYYRYKAQDMISYIRWGRVEKEIHKVIDECEE